MSRPATSTSSVSRSETVASTESGVKPQSGPCGHGTKERVVFSGPDGLRPHVRRPLHTEFDYVAECELYTPERTTSTSYLTSGPKSSPFPLAKHGRPGEIGWEAANFHALIYQRR